MNATVIPNIYSIIGSFLTVIVVLVGVLFVLKKIYGIKPNHKFNDKHISIVEILPLNQKQKIILCNVNDQEILLAVSSQSITSLAHWVSRESRSKQTAECKEDLISKKNIKDEFGDSKNTPVYEASSKGYKRNKINESSSDLDSNKKIESTKNQMETTNELLLLAKKVNQSIKKNISENMQ